MPPMKRYVKTQAKARQRRRLTAQERLERDRRQAQWVTEALQHALEDLGLPKDLVAEIAGRLRSQQQLLGKICGVMCPPLFGCWWWQVENGQYGREKLNTFGHTV